MLHTTISAHELRTAIPSYLPAEAGRRAAVTRQRQQEIAVDEALADSFPASDPPSWNAGIARPVARGAPVATTAPRPARRDDAGRGVPGVIDVSRPHADRTLWQGLISTAGATGIALLVPVAILLVGMPVALGVRGLLEVVLWLLTAFG